MCYNCGCAIVDNDMGNPDNITEKDFQKASKSTGQTVEETKKHVYEALKKELEEK